MNKFKKPWYIWFSLLALALLWGDTAWRTKFSRENIGIWTRACWNIFKLSMAYLIAPLLIFGLLIDIAIMRRVPEGSLIYEFGLGLVLVVVYFSGVYVTYRHLKWRKENMAHLLPGYEPPSEDKPQDDDIQ